MQWQNNGVNVDLNIPKVYNFGSGEVVELNHLCQTFDIKRRTAFFYLEALRITPVYFGKKAFFSLPTFNRIMYVLTAPDGPGFVFPGSLAKNNKKVRAMGVLTKVTDNVLEKAMRPETLAEMAAASGSDPAAVRKFASYRERPTKKQKENR